MTALLEKFEKATADQMALIANKIGHVYLDGPVAWTLHSCNDLGVPYFYRANQRPRDNQKLFTVARFRHIDDLFF